MLNCPAIFIFHIKINNIVISNFLNLIACTITKSECGNL